MFFTNGLSMIFWFSLSTSYWVRRFFIDSGGKIFSLDREVFFSNRRSLIQTYHQLQIQLQLPIRLADLRFNATAFTKQLDVTSPSYVRQVQRSGVRIDQTPTEAMLVDCYGV